MAKNMQKSQSAQSVAAKIQTRLIVLHGLIVTMTSPVTKVMTAAVKNMTSTVLTREMGSHRDLGAPPENSSFVVSLEKGWFSFWDEAKLV